MPNYEAEILVTGASGFLGSHIIAALTERGHQVVAAGRKAPQVVSANLQWLECDFTRDDFAAHLPSIHTVIHLAQSERFRDFPGGALDVFRVNVESTATLLDFARTCQARKFILASSGGVYGHGDTEFSEDHPAQPGHDLGYYLASKACAELLVDSYRQQLITQTLRFFFIYGPGQQSSMLIPRLAGLIKTGGRIALSGAEGIRLNPIFISDATAAVLASLSLETSQKFNVAGTQAVTLRELCAKIGQIVGREPVFEILDQEPRHLVGNTEKMCRDLESPSIPLLEGLKKLIASIESGNESA